MSHSRNEARPRGRHQGDLFHVAVSFPWTLARSSARTSISSSVKCGMQMTWARSSLTAICHFRRTGAAGHVALLGQRDPAGDGRPDELVPADGEAVRSGRKVPGRRAAQERQRHSRKGRVAVNVEPRNGEVAQDRPNAAHVVDCLLHRGADVGDHDGRGVAVDAQRLPQIVVVDLPVGQRADHDARHLQHAEVLADAVVRVLGIVDHAVRQQFARQVQSVQVPLRAAVGDIAPERIRGGVRQVRKPGKRLAFGAFRVCPVRAGRVRIAHIVQRQGEETVQVGVVEYSRAGIADERREIVRQCLKEAVKFLPQFRPGAGGVRPLKPRLSQRDHTAMLKETPLESKPCDDAWGLLTARAGSRSLLGSSPAGRRSSSRRVRARARGQGVALRASRACGPTRTP